MFLLHGIAQALLRCCLAASSWFPSPGFLTVLDFRKVDLLQIYCLIQCLVATYIQLIWLLEPAVVS